MVRIQAGEPMCGIIGIVGNENNIGQQLLSGIRKLEYRGYDSVGMATFDKKIEILKDIGSVQEVNMKEKLSELKGNIGMAHSRWATSGTVTKINAHPHSSCDGKIAIVHNGIIRNYETLRSELEKKGHKFKSECDSEVVAHYFEEKLKTTDIKQSCIDFFKDIEGEYAILVLIENDRIYALRKDSPLVLGISDDKNIIASDIFAFSDITNKAIFFDNYEFCEITKDEYIFHDKDGKRITKKIDTFIWDQEESKQEDYPHFMIKEIMEQKESSKRLINSLRTEQKEKFDILIKLIKESGKVTFTGAGSSYFASLLGVYFLHKCGINAQTLIASEFENFVGVDKDTLVIPISQSGETMDVIEALKFAKSKGARIASFVNVPYSTVQRMSDLSINILAGQEVAVAATKSFINPTILLLAIANEFGFNADLEIIPEKIEQVLSLNEKIKEISNEISNHNDIYIIGRGLSYPIAREIALKIKEISYIHAEGMMGGELKHGTIALIDKGTPVISLISNGDKDIITNTNEVLARGAHVIRISNENNGEINIDIPNDGTFAILSAIVGQLLAYHLANFKGLPIDKPRNLAKSVTVK